MDYDEVVERFTLLTGLSSDEVSEWSPILYDSMLEINARLSTDCDTDTYSQQISYAAASLANYKYRRILSAAGGDAQVKAGDVTITPDENAAEKAYGIYADSLKLLADILADDEFYFKGVDGLSIHEQ